MFVRAASAGSNHFPLDLKQFTHACNLIPEPANAFTYGFKLPSGSFLSMSTKRSVIPEFLRALTLIRLSSAVPVFIQ